MKAYDWSTMDRDSRLRIILDPEPRLQVDGPRGWMDQLPAQWPRELFAKLTEVIGESEDNEGWCAEESFEVVEIEEED